MDNGHFPGTQLVFLAKPFHNTVIHVLQNTLLWCDVESLRMLYTGMNVHGKITDSWHSPREAAAVHIQKHIRRWFVQSLRRSRLGHLLCMQKYFRRHLISHGESLDARLARKRNDVARALYDQIIESRCGAELAGKITGMMCGHFSSQVLKELAANPEELQSQIAEATRLLENAAMEPESIPPIEPVAPHLQAHNTEDSTRAERHAADAEYANQMGSLEEAGRQEMERKNEGSLPGVL